MKTTTTMKRSNGLSWWQRSAVGLLLTLLAAAPVLASAQGVISSSSTTGINLDNLFLPPTNSVMVNPGVTIDNSTSGSDAVFGNSTNWALMNSGTLNGSDLGVNFGFGVGGSVNNLTNALITGGYSGVLIYGTNGIVVNAGSIIGTNYVGVYLGNGGTVNN